jgi:hypothetical protein
MSGRKTNPRLWTTAAVSVLLFSGSFLAFDRLFFAAVRASARHYYASFGQDDYKFRASFGKGDGDLLIFGTSRTYCGLGLQILSNQLKKRIILEAASGKSPEYFYYFYQRHRKSFPKPKIVLYGLDYFMFWRKAWPVHLARLGLGIRSKTMDLASAANAKPPLLGRISRLYSKKPDLDTFLVDLLQLERGPAVENAAEKALVKNPNAIPPKGRGRPTGAYERTFKPKSWTTYTYYPFPGEEGAHLESLLTLLEQEGVPVFLLLIPDYVGTNESNIGRFKFRADVQALAARHRGVHVLDFNRKDRFNLNDPELFLDGGWGITNCHLSTKGRAIFTRQVTRAINRVLAAEKEDKVSGKGRAE